MQKKKKIGVTDRFDKTLLVSKADCLHDCEPRNISYILMRIALMPKHEDWRKPFMIPECYFALI